MNYYKNEDGEVYYYNDLQIKQGLHKGKKALTKKELEEHLKPAEPVEVREVSVEDLRAELEGLLSRAQEITEKLEKGIKEPKSEVDRD